MTDDHSPLSNCSVQRVGPCQFAFLRGGRRLELLHGDVLFLRHLALVSGDVRGLRFGGGFEERQDGVVWLDRLGLFGGDAGRVLDFVFARPSKVNLTFD